MMAQRNTSQQHGTDFENLMKTTHIFSNACNASRSGVAVHDIEGRHDRRFHLDTSVKAIGGGTIYLADGPRFYEINTPRRYLIGEWVQVNETLKHFVRIHELIVPYRLHKKACGDITAAEVLDYHNRIAGYPGGKEAANAARAERDWINGAIEGRRGIVHFDFKIDNHTQRRLQLSVSLKEFIDLVRNEPDYETGQYSQPLYTLHEEAFCQYPLPIALYSPGRTIVNSTPQQREEDDVNAQLFPIEEVTSSLVQGGAPMKRTPNRRDDQEKMDPETQRLLFG